MVLTGLPDCTVLRRAGFVIGTGIPGFHSNSSIKISNTVYFLFDKKDTKDSALVFLDSDISEMEVEDHLE